MSNGHSVTLVISKDVLMEFPDKEDRFIAFLIYWLSENQTKAVVTLSAWKEFESEWRNQLKGYSKEIIDPFFATMRGSITPYRVSYATEANVSHDNDKISTTVDEKTIVNWHYATVRYLVTETPDKYKGKSDEIKIANDSILTPKELYSRYEVEDESFVRRFLEEYES